MNKHLIWAVTLFSIVVVICGTLIYLNNNAWTMRFEMDNNTRDAIISVDFPTTVEKVPIYYDIDDNETFFVKENETYVEVEVR